MATKNICPQCGALVAPGQVFCGKCGQRLVFCKACGAINLTASGYCHSCGKPLVQVQTPIGPILTSSSSKEPRSPARQSAPITPQTPITSVDEWVLNYLSDHHGEISITRASQELSTSLQQLTESLSRLQSKGLIQKESAFVERMRNCVSCKRTIGADEAFCSYCGTKQLAVKKETQASLDPRTMKVTLTMLS